MTFLLIFEDFIWFPWVIIDSIMEILWNDNVSFIQEEGQEKAINGKL